MVVSHNVIQPPCGSRNVCHESTFERVIFLPQRHTLGRSAPCTRSGYSALILFVGVMLNRQLLLELMVSFVLTRWFTRTWIL